MAIYKSINIEVNGDQNQTKKKGTNGDQNQTFVFNHLKKDAHLDPLFLYLFEYSSGINTLISIIYKTGLKAEMPRGGIVLGANFENSAQCFFFLIR